MSPGRACGPASSLISPKRTTFPATPGAPSRPKHRSTRLAQRRGMALPKTGPSETWMSTTRPHGRVHAVSRLGQGHSAAPRTQAGGSRLLRAQGALLQEGVDGVEGLDARVAVGVDLVARERIVLAAIEQHRAHAGLAGRVELGHDVGEEHDVAGVATQLPGD